MAAHSTGRPPRRAGAYTEALAAFRAASSKPWPPPSTTAASLSSPPARYDQPQDDPSFPAPTPGDLGILRQDPAHEAGPVGVAESGADRGGAAPPCGRGMGVAPAPTEHIPPPPGRGRRRRGIENPVPGRSRFAFGLRRGRGRHRRDGLATESGRGVLGRDPSFRRNRLPVGANRAVLLRGSRRPFLRGPLEPDVGAARDGCRGTGLGCQRRCARHLHPAGGFPGGMGCNRGRREAGRQQRHADDAMLHGRSHAQGRQQGEDAAMQRRREDHGQEGPTPRRSRGLVRGPDPARTPRPGQRKIQVKAAGIDGLENGAHAHCRRKALFLAGSKYVKASL
jgi:hypothetical protein